MRRYYQTNGDLPESLMYISPTKTTTRGDQLIALDFKTGGFSKPKRWPWDQPGRVINGAGPHMVWHPNGRFITHRETARLLGFPDSWVTGSASTHKNLNMFWGKGTSVHPAHWVMEWVKNSMEGNPGSNVGEELDAGDRLIDVSMDYKPLWQAELARRGASEELVEVA
jgi:site-specific DNA-cytosine methylase